MEWASNLSNFEIRDHVISQSKFGGNVGPHSPQGRELEQTKFGTTERPKDLNFFSQNFNHRFESNTFQT